MPCASKSRFPHFLMYMTYLWFKLMDLIQTKHGIVVNSTNEYNDTLGLVRIGRFEHQIYHARQNMRDILMCRKWHILSEKSSFEPNEAHY